MLLEEKKQKKDSQNFCGQEGQVVYVVLPETGEQSYFEKFSHLHSCVHLRWIQDFKSSWRILCICTSGTFPASVVGILSKLIYVWDQINTMIYATMILGRE